MSVLCITLAASEAGIEIIRQEKIIPQIVIYDAFSLLSCFVRILGSYTKLLHNNYTGNYIVNVRMYTVKGGLYDKVLPVFI